MTATAPGAPRPIVPTGSTHLERVLDTTFPRGWGAMADGAAPAATAGNAALAPWVAQQWQVAQFAPYFASTADLLAQALPWLMQRGSAASVRRALGWLGYSAPGVQDIGPWLHLDPGRIVPPQALAPLAHVVRASLPAHVALYRIYHGHDVRPIVLDRGPQLDAGMLDGYSGVMDSASGVLQSYGVRRGATAPRAPTGQPNGARTRQRVSIARYDDMPILDAWRLDSRVLAAQSGGAMERTLYGTSAPPVGGGARARSQSLASTCAWGAPAPTGYATHTTGRTSGPPIHPPRHWGGPWGGPWRGHFQHTDHQEP